MTSKRKRIKELEQALETEREDYQSTHDSLWRVLDVLCDEFDLKLGIRPMSILEQKEQENNGIHSEG